MLMTFAAITFALGSFKGPLARPNTYVILNESLFDLTAIGFGLLMLIPYRWLARRCFGSSPGERAAALLALLCAIIGFPLSSYAAMRAANRYFDSEQPRVYELRDVSVGVSDGHPVLRTSNWPAGVYKPAELRLSDRQARAVTSAAEKTAMLHVGSGALGFQWIKKLVPGKPPLPDFE